MTIETHEAVLTLIDESPYIINLKEYPLRIDRGIFNTFLEKISGLSDEQSLEVFSLYLNEGKFKKECKRMFQSKKRYMNKSKQFHNRYKK
jgi:hypothetical protein